MADTAPERPVTQRRDPSGEGSLDLPGERPDLRRTARVSTKPAAGHSAEIQIKNFSYPKSEFVSDVFVQLIKKGKNFFIITDFTQVTIHIREICLKVRFKKLFASVYVRCRGVNWPPSFCRIKIKKIGI